jgi:hypothetical protein
MTLSRLLSPITLLHIALAVTACADDLKTDNDGEGSDNLTIETELKSEGVRETLVNATSHEKYLYIDLDKDAEVAESSADWDLAFQRFKIKSNGGESGDGEVIVAKVETAFDALTQAPSSGYVEDDDAVSSKSENGDPSYAFLGVEPWYEYGGSNHQLTPKDVVYVVRSTEEKFYKVEILDYYDKAGTAGFLRFQWAEIDAPAEPVSASEQKPDEEPTQEPVNEAASGCYDQKVHVCDCETDAAACEEAMGLWTDRCGCDTEQ